MQRTADQRRADLFAALPALVLDARARLAAAGLPVTGSPKLTPTVVLNVDVPVATVLELSAEPGTMDGYGPISAEHVRLLRPTVLRQILVDDLTGRPVAVDDRTTTVKPDPAAIRAQVLTMLRPEVVTDRAEPRHDPSARLARLVDILTSGCLVMIRLIPLVGTASCDADPPLRALLGASEPDLATGADRWRVGVARATPVGPSAQSGSHDIHGTRRPGQRRPGQRR